MSWQEFFPRHCLNEVALLRGFLGNLTRQVSRVFFLFFHHYFFPHHCVTLSICEYWNHSQSINGFLDHRFFSPPFLGVAKGESFCRASKSLCGRRFGIVLNRFEEFLDHRFFPRKSLWKVYYNSFKFSANLGFTPGRVPCYLFGNLLETCRKSHILRVVMQTMASNLAKPKRGKTTHIRRWFRDLLEHFPTSNVKIGGTVGKLCQIYHFWAFFVVKSLKQDNWIFFKKELLECPEHNATKRGKVGWKMSEILPKNGQKVGKFEFLRESRPCFGGCKAQFYRQTTWQAFIFHQKKSFKQHTSEIGGGRCNCLVSWCGMIPRDYGPRLKSWTGWRKVGRAHLSDTAPVASRQFIPTGLLNIRRVS